MDTSAQRESAFGCLNNTLKQVEERITQVLGASVTVERRLISPAPSEAAEHGEAPSPEAILPLIQQGLQGILRQANEAYGILERLERELSS